MLLQILINKKKVLMLKFAFSVFLAVVYMLGSTDAAAAPVRWSNVASGCVLDSRYAANAEVDAQTGSVSFKAGVTGYILLTCPVTVPISGAGCGWGLGITAKEPVGGGGGIIVQLSANALSNAAVTAIKTYTVPTSASPVYTIQTFAHSFNFNTHYYYVHVNMQRTVTTDTQFFYGTAIDETGC